MKKYILIARSNIIGIHDDYGLKALNGYAEKIIEIKDECDLIKESELYISQIKKENPRTIFDDFEFIEYKAS